MSITVSGVVLVVLSALSVQFVLIGASAQDLVFTGKPPEFENYVFTAKPPEFEDYGYLVRDAAWNFSEREPVIFVCWENPTPENSQERVWVQAQINETWQRYARVDFRGWAACAEKNAGIRIVFADEGPHVNAFGAKIDGMKNGMLLNYRFENWGQSCQAEREACIRSIAVHEFGHALGFAHEQNRPDTPGECSAVHGQDQSKERMLTPYDPRSVMNYCNPKYNNNGQLSKLDIAAVQKVYGAR
jgi:hypothetical protein